MSLPCYRYVIVLSAAIGAFFILPYRGRDTVVHPQCVRLLDVRGCFCWLASDGIAVHVQLIHSSNLTSLAMHCFDYDFIFGIFGYKIYSS